MSINDRFDRQGGARRSTPRPADTFVLRGGVLDGRGAGADAQESVCYCGHYENCPHWAEMTPEARRACSADKRMTVESLWKSGVRGA